MYCTITLLPWSTCPTSRPMTMTELPRLLLLVTKGIFFSRPSCCAPGEVQLRLPAV